MSLLRKSLLVFASMLPICALAVTTNTQPVKSVLFDGSANYIYVTAANTWGADGCANAQYVQITSAVPGFKQLYAAILAAQATGKTVRFQGTCATNPNYFEATYIEVQ